MAEQQPWLKGKLTGTCLGKPARKRGGSGLARWYQLQLVEAVIDGWEPVAGPPTAASEGAAPFSQALLRDARLRALQPGGTDEELSLRELSVWDWKMSDQREGGGESRCTLRGMVYTQVVAGTRRPVLPEGSDRLGASGCLAVLAGLLIAFWLWWSCGPFTCGVWSSVVLVSWWSHSMRTRRRTPPGLASKILQGLLGLILILGAAGVVLGIADPARASSCGELGALSVLLALASVVGVSLLSVSWPLPWSWTLWTIVVVMWCGRTGTDCAVVWLKRAEAIVRGVAPERPPILENGPGKGSGKSGSGTGTGTGTGDGNGNGDGSGTRDRSGTGDGNGTEDGKGTGKGNGTETRTGTDADGGPRTATDLANDPTGNRSVDAGRGSGRGAGPTTASAPGDAESLEAASEPRMTVDAALNDPKPFLDGSTRVTLSSDLLFEFDEDRLKPEAETRLRQVAQLLRLDPGQRVLLEGHADTIGGDQYNQELSERRAEAVKAWLVEKTHLNPLRIDTVGYGSARPVVPASRGPAAQRANRRVELQVQH